MISAKRFAIIAHGDQLYGDKPYPCHLRDVASRFCPASQPQEYKVAWLHDTLEDTKVTYCDLCDLFGFRVAEPVRLLTRTKDSTYFEFIQSIKDSRNEVAIAVKIADNLSNIRAGAKEGKLMERYLKSLEILGYKEKFT